MTDTPHPGSSPDTEQIHVGRLRTRANRLAARCGVIVLVCVLAVSIWAVVRPPAYRDTSPLLIDDVTRLNAISVGSVIEPTTTEEIRHAVKSHNGPISIGGTRHSMGGQIATDGGLHLDMRRFDKIVNFSSVEKSITVQAGTRWRQIQEHIDPANLSVSIMQSYANFTVGGSISVNVHGRYAGLGPLILSLKSLKVVLADGSLIEASPVRNTNVFNAVVGGYGGLGVITEATLDLTDNVKLKRQDRTLPVTQYGSYFADQIRRSPSAVFHHADLYPDAYDTVHTMTYAKTDEPLTIRDRLIPKKRWYAFNRFAYWAVSEWPFGKALRQHVLDPVLFAGEPVTWRNYEASYDTAELEPASRKGSTYVLEEYFVPVNQFDEFVPQLRQVLQRHKVNVINISIRHAKQDPGSLLAWARSDVFGFVVYYKQGTSAAARPEVAVWSRELIERALNTGGSYYLPYQLHATEEQFLRAYPRAGEFFEVKRRLDPTNKFRNRLWDKYYHPFGIVSH